MDMPLAHISNHYRGLWVAVSGDSQTLLGSGETAEEAFTKARRKGDGSLFITHLPEEDEVPNEDLLAAIAEAEEEERKGTLTYYSTAEELIASLD